MPTPVNGGQTAGSVPIPNAPVYVAGLNASGQITGLLVGSDGTLALAQSTNSTIYASASRTSNPTVVDQTNNSCSGIVVVINCTAVSGSSSVVFAIKGKDNLGIVYTILTSAAIVGTGTTVLRVYPNLTAAANTAATALIPKTYQVTATHGTADATTYSVTASLVP